VESSVIRLVPIDPPPPVKFEEFDGMNRIIFSRPNKTVRGNFQAKGVMKMLEQNRSTWLSMQDMVRVIASWFFVPLVARKRWKADIVALFLTASR
jgi:16S rRNA A1518/A1519 N6-dimethyltransferase RsmA/KsgA/DIM1 with predicted DNA glycosylase/AP lyase activity